MGFHYDDIEDAEEDRAFLERMEQRKRRRMLERKRRERKKRIMKRLFVGGFICIIIIVCIIIAVRNGKDTSEKQENISAQESMTESGSEKSVHESGVGESGPESDTENSRMKSDAQESTTESGSEEITAEKTIEDVEEAETEESQIYKFESTSDTVNISSEEVISSHAILVDANTDTIIATKGAHDRIIPASMTKVLTALVAAEVIEEAWLNDTFTMTKEITEYAYVNDCSSVGFLEGEVVTVKDLFYGTILPSGGDAAVALATYAAGSQEAFVDLMNEKLEELGLAESAHFTNCVGIHDENHYCTVYDMAVIMKAAMQNELCREVLSAHTYTTTSTTQHPDGITISNWFLRRIEDKETGGIVVGGKTGYVTQSGSCAVSYEESADGTPYICVTVGSTSSWRCIYDHVEIYNRYIPSLKTKEEE